MARTMLRGKGISFTVDGEEFNLDTTRVLFSQQEREDDFVTFAMADEGDQYEWLCSLTAGQSLEAASLHTMLWDNAGQEADFVFAPKGNATPSVSEPHFTGTVAIDRKPDLGGEVNATWTFEAELRVVGTITKVTA